MENFDKDIRKKLSDRRIKPSASAWERMSEQLDAVEKKNNKKWFLYVGYAASILLLVSLFFLINRESTKEIVTPKEVYVKQSIDTSFIKTSPIEIVKESKEVIVSNTKDGTVKKIESENSKTFASTIANIEAMSIVEAKIEISKIAIEPLPKNFSFEGKEFKGGIESRMNSKSLITVSSDALLYAVTHDKEDVRSYYKKYLISRHKVLETIQEELKRSKLKVNANLILAEVERDLTEESFQNNFLQMIKKRVSDVATVIASRND